ncbi:hypothetical protein GWD55_08420 [Staphylococcus pseudintermedius]|nr:hypothetical protein [Staphylococcus pseudintermedius]
MTQRFRRTAPERLARLPKELFRFSSYNNIKHTKISCEEIYDDRFLHSYFL